MTFELRSLFRSLYGPIARVRRFDDIPTRMLIPLRPSPRYYHYEVHILLDGFEGTVAEMSNNEGR